MATSGSKDFSLTRDRLIKSAIRLAGGANRTAHPEDEIDNATEALNMIVKHWQAEEIGIWMTREVNIYFQEDTISYDLGPAGYFAYASDAVKTELASTASASDATIEVDSATGIANGYVIGIQLDDGSIQWTTVNGAPVGTTITLTDVVSGMATTYNHVYCYSAVADRPLNIDNARLVKADGTEIPINIKSRSDYQSMTTKTSQGSPNMIYFDRQLTNAKAYFWPVPNNMQEFCKVDAQIEIDDFDAATDDAELPKQAYRALKWNLAAELLPEYRPKQDDGGVYMATVKYIIDNATQFKAEFERFDCEPVSVIIERKYV